MKYLFALVIDENVIKLALQTCGFYVNYVLIKTSLNLMNIPLEKRWISKLS